MATSGKPARFVLFVFNESNLALLGFDNTGRFAPFWTVEDPDPAFGFTEQAAAAIAATGYRGIPRPIAPGPAGESVWFALCEPIETTPDPRRWELLSLAELFAIAERTPERLAPELHSLLPLLREHTLRIPYLNHEENDYIYRFRTERQRNRAVYRLDDRARALYQSALCEAIKRLKRTKERSSAPPAELDFGAVRYVLPSHFGFCLGVQNAIERAYETIATSPGRAVYMLSELIHNPFVNEDLAARGLRYLQTDQGIPSVDPATGRTYWEQLRQGDIVIIPAFGATDADKRRLIERGIALNRYDATCMLVEKVWKAAQRYGQAGFTVVIHGKHEHEETKATFSNSARHAPSLILRDRAEAERLAAAITAPTADAARAAFAPFADRCTPDFDPSRHLARLAVVNQTTLLRNETLAIIDLLEGALAARYGRENLASHFCAESRGDTLCYATQVNQDALQRALALPLDAAIVVGGRNSSNTFQLYRLCAARLGSRAHYISSERHILSRETIEHYVYPYRPEDARGGCTEPRPFLPPAGAGDSDPAQPLRLLVTGGASCPDGLIQQVVARVNSFFPPEKIRPIAAVLADLEAGTSSASPAH
jgi:4-hydroxy-3-methylbut-2-enyl diphosphate reductase